MVVYVVAPFENYNGRVKIGSTAGAIQARLSGLQTGSPLRLDVLWSAPGGYKEEKWLHSRFSEYRVLGEWFDFSSHDPVSAIDREYRSRFPESDTQLHVSLEDVQSLLYAVPSVELSFLREEVVALRKDKEALSVSLKNVEDAEARADRNYAKVQDLKSKLESLKGKYARQCELRKVAGKLVRPEVAEAVRVARMLISANTGQYLSEPDTLLFLCQYYRDRELVEEKYEQLVLF